MISGSLIALAAAAPWIVLGVAVLLWLKYG